MMKVVTAQFSGNAKVYSYVTSQPDVQPGDRAVVINKMKDDGTPSLSIVTILEVRGWAQDDAKLAPLVQVISMHSIANAVQALKLAEVSA